MKGALLLIAIFALSMLVIPMLAVSRMEKPPQETLEVASLLPAEDLSVAEEASPPAQPPAMPVTTEAEDAEYENIDPKGEQGHEDEPEFALAGVEEFLILDESTGEVYAVPVQDFVRGAVAAEMPARFHAEALKAQAVAAHTYALHQQMIQSKNPDPALKGADFSADPSNMLVYITQEKAKEFYGARADEYWEKICHAADSVAHLALAYGDEPIVAAYHAISAGVTEDAANVWLGGAPYLKPAHSEGDYLAPDYETELFITAEQFERMFSAVFSSMSFGEDVKTWIGETERSPSGYVTYIEIGGMELHGKDVREVLGLRSHNFEVLSDERGFTFVVYGYGHGVGLSQYGADFMARQGADFREILANYFAGAELCEVVAIER